MKTARGPESERSHLSLKETPVRPHRGSIPRVREAMATELRAHLRRPSSRLGFPRISELTHASLPVTRVTRPRMA